MTLLAVSGWLAAVALAGWVLALRARIEAVARADHELRGPVAALALAGAALARAPGMRERGIAMEGQVDRLRAALADLAAARGRRGRRGRRSRVQTPPPLPLEEAVRGAAAGWAPVAEALGRRLRVDWRAGTAAAAIDRGRLAQSLGNVLANALEHGGGDVAVRAERTGAAVTIEVRDGGAGPRRGARRRSGRGRGLAIAARAAEEAGGSLTLRRDEDGASAAIELPAAS
ncbi:MAG: ATP-binding protein [Thermoleophilaceae bacterium]